MMYYLFYGSTVISVIQFTYSELFIGLENFELSNLGYL